MFVYSAVQALLPIIKEDSSNRMRKAIIAGATSGIGKELAKILAENNYMVGITGRRNELLAELKNEQPERFITKNFDITNLETTIVKLKELTEELGGLDLLVISSGTGDLNDTLNFETEKRTIDTNVLGFTNIVDWAFNYFKNQNSGHLVAITSIGGLRGGRQAPSYNASKAYQQNYLEGIRQKVKKLNLPITLTDIRPGLVNTEMAKGEGLFWVMPVKKAANQISNAIKKKKKIAYITKRWALVALFMKLVPGFIYDRM